MPTASRRPPLRSRPARVGAAALLALLVAAGCSPARDAGPPSQVVARVNGSDITVHQVQAVLQRQQRPAGAPETAARRTLEGLVEQELAAQAARAEGLDKDPEVLQMLEVARREVLARAYQDRLAAHAPGTTSDEIDRFYDSQPALFARRRLYVLHEFQFDAAEAELERVMAVAKSARNERELGDRFGAAGLRFRERVFAQAAEDLPAGLLAQLADAEVGQTVVVPQAQLVRVVHVLHATLAPVDRRTASNVVAAYLRAERRRAEVHRGMQTLRDVAKIEFQGNFAAPAAPAASQPAR